MDIGGKQVRFLPPIENNSKMSRQVLKDMELDDMLGSMTDAIMRDLKKNTKHKSAPHHVSKREETKSSGSDSKSMKFFVNQITELSLTNTYRKSKILIKL